MYVNDIIGRISEPKYVVAYNLRLSTCVASSRLTWGSHWEELSFDLRGVWSSFVGVPRHQAPAEEME